MKNVVSAVLFTACAAVSATTACSAETIAWPNGATTAISLSYDDAIDSQLDHAVPALDRHGFKASFYMVMSSETLQTRLQEWREVAAAGHELGNHTLFHPCSASLPDRDWVAPYHDMDQRTVEQMRQEVLTANAFLRAIDGRTLRTFTPPCGDLLASGENYLPAVADEFVAIKGQLNGMSEANSLLWGPVGQSGAELIAFVKEHTREGMLLNILFHGVGGDYLSVSTEAHAELLQFLAEHRQTYWVDTYLNIMQHVQAQQ